MGTDSSAQRPSVGVIIAAYNAERSLDLALSSVFHQTVPPDQVVVVDDCSSDSTVRIAREWLDRLPLRVLSNANNLGVGSSRSRGIAKLDTDYVAVLDADDIWLPEHLSMTRSHLGPTRIVSPLFQEWNEGKGLGGTFGSAHMRRRAQRADDQLSALLRENFVASGSTFPRPLYDAVGGFPPTRFAEDYGLWVKLVVAGARVVFLEAPTVLYRRHSGSLSVVTSETEEAKLESLDQIAELVPARYADDVEHARRVARARVLLCREKEEHPATRRARAVLLWPALRRAPLRQKLSVLARLR